MFKIKHLKIDNILYTIINSELEDRLDCLSKVNIFTGANNSGKSMFMRFLFYNNNLKLNFLPNDKCFEYFIEQSNKFKEYINQSKNNAFYSNERDALINIHKNLNDIEYLIESQTPCKELVNIHKNIHRNNFSVNSYQYFCDKIFNEYFGRITFDENLLNYNFYKIYIPSLRGLIPLIPENDLADDTLNKDYYAERVKLDYFDEKSDILVDITGFLTEENVETRNAIVTGQKYYDYVRNYLLGDLNQRKIIAEYEEYLSETFFDNKEVALIPKVNSDVLTVKIGNEKERPIYNLGEGIQSIISITLPLFLYLRKSKEKNTCVLVFIEEPEVGLHPVLQRKLLKTLLSSKFDNYQFFFTTHSNHFIDTIFHGEDISIYSFDKYLDDGEDSVAKFSVEKVEFNHMPTLKKLGALPSSVLMNNCTIMVEGSRDKEHYSLYLKLYQDYLESKKPNFKRFTEGIHYSFLIGGGSEAIESIKDFSEIEKERVFSIFDNDSAEKTTKLKKLFSDLDYVNYYILDVKEVENLINVDSVVKIIQKVYNVQSRDINQDFDENDYYNTYKFYEFIVETILKGKEINKFPKDKSKLKNQLSKSESEFTTDFEDLTDEAKKVAIEIYKVIKKINPKINS